ncbi:GatB/YqeY domain-containing protein [Saprospira grandis]|uniref:YqeY family protein n=1 Tax=Saprospira grandis (strain Lewin) TaxID=984262 RepID=H6L338_SAPGL|nr:GatB/YqeY domain-containing protein [Saprospira grandis]AFC24865.1 YqeY family protein [Saprospira grandis str. Lewin]WBM76249.1 GatB/YqeY domain-containing protein [Saprospira grandis]
MSLSERIKEGLKTAMKNKDEARKRTIRAIKAQLLLMQTDGTGAEITEERELKMLQTMVKQREDSLTTYQEQGREELAQVEAEEIAIIKEFLPAQLEGEALVAEIKAIIEEAGASSMKDMGRVMGMASKKLLGKADGKSISATVKQLLG